LDTPYTGTYHSFAGVTTLNGGNFKITNNGMQFGSSSNFTANDGVVLLGWGLRALTSGTFQQTSGTFEFIGNRSCDIQLASNNWFNNLTINKTGTPADVYLSTNVTVKKDLNIVAGNLLCFHHLLTVNWDVVITGGVLNAGYSDDEIKVGRNWNNHVGPSAFIEGNGRVTFFSNLDGKIYHNENFNNLKMNKEIVNLSYLSIYTDVTVNVSGTVDLISGTLLLRDGALFEVAGDMNISGSRVWNYFLEYEMMIHVGGVTSIASSAEVLLNNGSLECDGILNLYGKLDVGNGLFTLHGDFVNLSNSILNINNGRFICTAPYASAWQNINGHFALTGASGIFEFQDRGIQLTSTFDGQISGGKIRTGRGFLATTQNIFRPTGGTLEFFGELAATLTCSNGNWINDLSISKTNAAIVLGSGLTVKGDLMIVSGALSSSSYTINLNGMWDNQVGASGFGEGTGTVCFQGTGNRIINGNETFYNLSIDLTPGSSTPYMYSSGAVTMMNNLNIISGVVNLTMNAIWAVLGDITISYGACLNIAGVIQDLY